MVWQTLGLFKSLIYYESVIIDDFIFRFHYSFTSYMLLFASLLVTGKIYLGDPIHCSLGVSDYTRLIPQDMLNTYCYIHSTFTIPSAEINDAHSYPGVGPHTPEEKESGAIYQSYYQWVPLLLLLQGLTFFVPRLLWYKLEDGTVKSLRLDLHLPHLDSDKQSEQVTKLVNYLKNTLGRHKKYARDYFICMMLNIANVVLQIVITDQLLGGQFISYGWKFSYRTRQEGVVPAEDIIFPKMSKCHLDLFGPSGTLQKLDALCVLPLNILHDKVYLILWYWYLVLFVVTVLQFLDWLRHRLFRGHRMAHMHRHIKGHVLGNHLAPFNQDFGDWFLLHLIYKNVTYPNFVALVSEMADVKEDDVVDALLKREANIDFEAALPSSSASKLGSQFGSRRVSTWE